MHDQCEHCGSWQSHESRFCPEWRRCQRCRERGHDKNTCSSRLQASPSEVPCDLCGSPEHLEADCDLIWKVPSLPAGSDHISVSMSCCYCASNRHLIGDCPKRRFPMNSSSWSLRGYNPSVISNISSLPGVNDGRNGGKGQPFNHKIKGRANRRSPSTESDGPLGNSHSNQWAPINRPPQRGNIRISSGIGRKFSNDNSPNQSRGRAGEQYSYRDRDQSFGNNTRQRSISPDLYQSRQKGGSNIRYPPPRSRSPPNRSRGNSRGGGRGKSRGSGPSRGGRESRTESSKDTYRPLPSAGKKAWDKFRL